MPPEDDRAGAAGEEAPEDLGRAALLILAEEVEEEARVDRGRSAHQRGERGELCQGRGGRLGVGRAVVGRSEVRLEVEYVALNELGREALRGRLEEVVAELPETWRAA